MNKVIVSNLPPWISDVHLKDAFMSCGTVLQATLILDKKFPRPLGYGYVTFSDEQGSQAALKKHQTKIDGFVISVHLVEEHLLGKAK